MDTTTMIMVNTITKTILIYIFGTSQMLSKLTTMVRISGPMESVFRSVQPHMVHQSTAHPKVQAMNLIAETDILILLTRV